MKVRTKLTTLKTELKKKREKPPKVITIGIVMALMGLTGDLPPAVEQSGSS